MARHVEHEQRERELLPRIARTFAANGYQNTSLRDLAQACAVDVVDLKEQWGDKPALFIAALEFAYEAAERTWALLLHPEPSLEAAERLLAFAGNCGDSFTISRMVHVGLDADVDPRVRKTLRRMNRRLARFLACEVTAMHMAALNGEVDEAALRSQAGAVLRQLAHVQQEADAEVDATRARLIDNLERAVDAAKRNANGGST